MISSNRFALTLGAVCALVLLSCQQNGNPSPTAPDPQLRSVVSESHAGGNGKDNSFGVGAVKADSACSNSCSDIDREDNTIRPGSNGYAWIVSGTSEFCDTYFYSISQKGAQIGGGILGFNQSCDDKTRGYTFYVPYELGTATLTITCNDKDLAVIGSDSFRIMYDDDCSK